MRRNLHSHFSKPNLFFSQAFLGAYEHSCWNQHRQILPFPAVQFGTSSPAKSLIWKEKEGGRGRGKQAEVKASDGTLVPNAHANRHQVWPKPQGEYILTENTCVKRINTASNPTVKTLQFKVTLRVFNPAPNTLQYSTDNLRLLKNKWYPN